MCGICGIWNRDGQPADVRLLQHMRDSMAHRGPDGAGAGLFTAAGTGTPIVWTEPDAQAPTGPQPGYNLGFGHRRLSIIDLNTGDQPMCNEDRSIWIVFNGEIYNYRELRAELQAQGHTFHSESDTEVIVHAYEQYGEACTNHLNGIFAFALWDGRRRCLFLARDHFGVKPLYYHVQGDHFYFASEIKAILAAPGVENELNASALNLALIFRYVPSPWTLFQGVRKLAPGSSLTVTADGLREQRYWQPQAVTDRGLTEAEWMGQLRDAMEQAVVRQMVSDVPIGISLSSGVDSNAVLALMSRHSSGPVRAFTVGFAGREDASEIEPARKAAERYGAEFHEQVISAGDYADFMERYIWHLEEPIGNSSAAAYYFVAEMARRQGVKVLLNGQGSDEAFAGYSRHLWGAYGNWLRLGTAAPLRTTVTRLLRGTRLGERYERALFTMGAGSDDERLLRVYSIIGDDARCALIRPEILDQIELSLPLLTMQAQLQSAPQGSLLERMMHVDARTSLPDDLLMCEDKMAMAASVEARVPFLDREFMAVAERIPGRFKLQGRRNKAILRKALTPLLGSEVAWRRKIGFENAFDVWLRAQLGDRMRDMVSAPGSFTRTYLNPGYVLGMMQEHANRQRDHSRLLFLFYSLESWHSRFMTRQDVMAA